jgi:hypothetical protein
MNNILKQNFVPKSENVKANYIKNYIHYSLKNRTIFQNTYLNNSLKFKNNFNSNKSNSTNNIFVADDKYREQQKIKILQSFEKTKNNNFFNKINIFNNNKNDLNNYNRSLSTFRMNRLNKENNLLDKRNSIKNSIQKKFDIQNILIENIKNLNDINNKPKNGYNFSELLDIYKEGLKYLGNNNELLDKYFKIVSKKKEENIVLEINKIKDKKKEPFVKILEDIQFNNYIISETIIEELKNKINELKD